MKTKNKKIKVRTKHYKLKMKLESNYKQKNIKYKNYKGELTTKDQEYELKVKVSGKPQ